MSAELILPNNEINIDAACEAIGTEWKTTITAMFNIVDLIRKVEGKKGFQRLQEALEDRGIMKRSVFTMFKAIAENHLIQANIKEKLPSSYNTLYYLARIDDQDIFESAIKDGTISPDSKLEDIKSFVAQLQRSESEVYDSYKPKQSKLNLASIKVDPSDFKKHKTQIIHLLNELQNLGLVIKLGKEFETK